MREPRERPDLKKSASSESCPSKTLTLCGPLSSAHRTTCSILQYEEAEEEYSRMSWEEDRIIKAVNAIPAKTEAGLRVRALAVCLSRNSFPVASAVATGLVRSGGAPNARIVHLSARHRRGGRPDHHRYAGGRLIRPPSAARAASGRPSAEPAARLREHPNGAIAPDRPPPERPSSRPALLRPGPVLLIPTS